MAELVAAIVLASSDNTVPLYTVSGMLVIAMGYMLRDRRDTDKRVDVATAARLADAHAERDRALAAEEAAYRARDGAIRDRDQAQQQLNLLGYRLQVAEARLKALEGNAT